MYIPTEMSNIKKNIFQEIVQLLQNSRSQMCDMTQVPYWGPNNFMHHHKIFSRLGVMVPCICPSVSYSLYFACSIYVFTSQYVKSDILTEMMTTAFLDAVLCGLCTNVSDEPAASVFRVEEFANISQLHLSMMAVYENTV